MANPKSEQHVIPLIDPDLCRERLRGEIRPWQGFNDRNSPILSGECLPLWTKELKNLDEGSWISPSLDVYDTKGWHLNKNGVQIGNTLDKLEIRQIINNNHDTMLGGTLKTYCMADYGVDNVYIYLNGLQIATISYGAGFSWDKAVSYFSLFTHKGPSDKDYIAVCWQGKCYVIVNDNGSVTTYTSPSLLDSTSTTPVANQNTSIALNYDEEYICFLNDNPKRLVLFDMANLTWDTRTSLSLDIPYNHSNPYGYNGAGSGHYTGTVNIEDCMMDSLGWWQITKELQVMVQAEYDDSYDPSDPFAPDMSTAERDLVFVSPAFTLNATATILRSVDFTGTLMCITPDFVPWEWHPIPSDPDDPPPLFPNDPYSANTTWVKTNDKLVSSKYCKSKRLYYVTGTSSTAANYNWGVTVSTNPYITTATGLKSGVIEKGSISEIIHNTNNTFRILFEQGLLSGISADTELGLENRGTLLTDWGSIEDCYIFDNQVGFKSIKDGQWYCITWEYDTSSVDLPKFTVYKDRYIIIKTAKYYNTYDIKTETWMHFADDWNNRYMGSYGSYANYYLLASGFESEYLISKYPFPGRLSSTIWAKDAETSDSPGVISKPIYYEARPCTGYKYNSGQINFFASKDEAYDPSTEEDYSVPNIELTYIVSYRTGWIKDSYGKLYWSYEDNPLINPPLFSKFQTDLFTLITTETSTVVALQQNGMEFLIYYLGTADTNFNQLCCVQSMFYGLTDDGIYQVTLSEGLLSNPKKIINITGLQYIAYTPICIYFWNNKNRTMYLFSGDAILKPIQGESIYSSITQSKFKPDTEETFLVTNNGVYVSARDYCYRIDGLFSDIFYTDYGFALKYGTGCICYSYYPATGHTTRVPMMLETMLYGAGNNIVSTTDCIYFRFYKGDTGDNEIATVKVSGSTLTDLSTPLQQDYKEFTINPSDWDHDTQTYYLRYQPTYQKGIGMSIKVESDAPLIYMGFGATQNSLQITK